MTHNNVATADSKPMKQIFMFSARLLITVFVFWYLSHKVNIHQVLQQMPSIDVKWLVLAIVVGLFSYFLIACRWQVIVATLGGTIDRKRSICLVYVAMFFNQFMLASVGGDVIRIILSARYFNSKRIAINSTLFDRLFGVFAIVCIIAVCYPIYLRVFLPAHRVALISLSFLVLAFIAGLFVLCNLDRLPILKNIPLFKATLAKLAPDARYLFLKKKNIVVPLMYSIIAVLQPNLIVFLLAKAYHMPIIFSHCMAIVPVVMLVSLMPISIAGWGVREGSMVVVASFLGVTGPQALLLSFWLGIVLLLASLPGAYFWLKVKFNNPAIVANY